MAGEGWGEKKFIPRGWSTVKNRERGGGGGGEDYVYLKSLFSQKSVRPRTEFLIGAVRLQLSITSQMCHLSVILTFRSCWRKRKRKMANSDCELVSFYSTVEETLDCLSEYNVGKKRSSFYAGSWKGFTGGYRMRQISTRICLSREHFGEAIFFVDEKNTHTVSPEFSGLHQINYGG